MYSTLFAVYSQSENLNNYYSQATLSDGDRIIQLALIFSLKARLLEQKLSPI